MELHLSTTDILEDILLKGHLTSLSVADFKERDRVRPDDRKLAEIKRSLMEADSSLRVLTSRFLEDECPWEYSNELNLPESLCYKFWVSERRNLRRGQSLADYMHSYLVNMTLYRYYETIKQKEFAAQCSQAAATDASFIVQIIFTKQPPKF